MSDDPVKELDTSLHEILYSLGQEGLRSTFIDVSRNENRGTFVASLKFDTDGFCRTRKLYVSFGGDVYRQFNPRSNGHTPEEAAVKLCKRALSELRGPMNVFIDVASARQNELPREAALRNRRVYTVLPFRITRD